jgi:transcriptional regulator with XRE-family HTH domain
MVALAGRAVMARKKAASLPPDVLAKARQKAAETRRKLEHLPGPSKLLAPQERDDAAPFYFVLREYVRQLKAARKAAGLTLGEVSARSGIAEESLSRLETGAQTNPTWKTLGLYAIAIGRQPRMAVDRTSVAPNECASNSPPPRVSGQEQSGQHHVSPVYATWLAEGQPVMAGSW